MKKCLLFVLLCLTACLTFAEPLPADVVFQVNVQPHDPNSFLLHWHIKPNYFLYSDRIKLSTGTQDVLQLGDIQLPTSVKKIDRLGHEYNVYRNELLLTIPILGLKPGTAVMVLNFQGCSDAGFCYPPEQRNIQLTINQQLAVTSATFIQPIIALKHTATIQASTKDLAHNHNDIASIFTAHYWPFILLTFFGLGLLLTFTPCVLPMIPVLSGIIVGHKKALSTQKAFTLSLSYVLGMAGTYALVGIVVALLGKNLQVVMQSPIVIGALAFIFVLLALSMFGWYELKLPLSLQTKLAGITREQSRGHHLNAVIMGCLSTLVLSPCVTPPLVGVLGYIAETGNLLLGGAALFSLGLGMGAPLLLIGTSAGKYLPKAGYWMNAVKSFFGFLLLAVAIYLLNRIIPTQLSMVLWAVLFIISGVYAGAFTNGATHREKIHQSLGVILLTYGIVLFVGASMGNDNPLQPLATKVYGASPKHASETMPLIATTPEELKQLLANSQGTPVILDFYADWCTSCKIMEKTTFTNPALQQALQKFIRIKVDVTRNQTEQQDLLKDFHVVAPPTFVFLNNQGEELTNFRLVGELSSEAFLQHLQALNP